MSDVVLVDDQVVELDMVRQAFRDVHRSVMLYSPTGTPTFPSLSAAEAAEAIRKRTERPLHNNAKVVQ